MCPRRYSNCGGRPLSFTVRRRRAPTLKPIIGFFAVVGIAWFAFAIYANLFLMDCAFSQAAQAVSPNGEHFAVFEEHICKESDKSWSGLWWGNVERWSATYFWRFVGRASSA